MNASIVHRNVRCILLGPRILVLPVCHDAMSARLDEDAGFELVSYRFAVLRPRSIWGAGLISYA